MVDRQRRGIVQNGDQRAAELGVLLLDANALTIPGAVSHPESFGLPTTMVTVSGATAQAITTPLNDQSGLKGLYREAAVALAADGVHALTTNCGFTLPFQQELQQSTRLPVVSSALLLLPALNDVYGAGLGVLTYDVSVLRRMLERSWDGGHASVAAVDVRESQAWGALEKEAGSPVDTPAMCDDLISIAEAFVSRHDLAALLLECTGFAPFAEALRMHLHVPIFDHITIVRFLLGAQLQPAEMKVNECKGGRPP